ncbi:MAG: radical SAM protein [Solirubrobacterales bacterium]
MRWDEQRVDKADGDLRLPGIEDSTVVRTFDAPEAMGIRFHEVSARSALNHVPGGRYGFNWTINPFRGCTHACVFCFARKSHTFLGFDAGRDFEREIVVKVNVPELLRVELRRPSWGRELVALGTNTDPYQWAESRYRLMPEILAALEEADTPVSVLTKSPLVLRDIDLYERMAKRLPVSVNLSVPTLDESAWRATEPHTPSPRARLEAVAELRRRGIESGVLIAPLMPGINDSPEQVQPIVDLAREAGASFLGGVALHLRDEVRDVFFGWLEAKRPDLLPRYEQLYSGDRAYLHPAQRKRITTTVRGWGRTRTARRGRQSLPPPRARSTRSKDPSADETVVPGRTGSPRGQEALF